MCIVSITKVNEISESPIIPSTLPHCKTIITKTHKFSGAIILALQDTPLYLFWPNDKDIFLIY